ncbi:MAG: ABC transporter ATP-binding protein [Actinomycetota bacterium]
MPVPENEAESPSTAVLVNNLEVEYRVYHDRVRDERSGLAGRLRSKHIEIVQALRGVSFSVNSGEAVGIVGSNGSGKSTLLRAIAGVQAKSAGSVRVRGEARLLSVGATLKPQLSGYRNVKLGALAMGLTTEEIEEGLDGLVEFSGLGDAMARPLKTYSQGMKARLLFSIATLHIPNILLIDEALAVGDRQFKRRSLERIRNIRAEAGTVLMVTHNMSEIRNTCTRAVWMDGGQIVADGDVEDVLARYDAASE